jgi:hypothetical protein
MLVVNVPTGARDESFGVAEVLRSPAEHIVNGLVISRADKDKVFWRNARRFFDWTRSRDERPVGEGRSNVALRGL